MDTTNTPTNLAERERTLESLMVKNDPRSVKMRSLDSISGVNGEVPEEKNLDLVKYLSLNEFKTGALLDNSVSDLHGSLAIDLMRKLQTEYSCSTTSEQATTELIALNYARILDVQKLLNNFLHKDSYGDLTIKIIGVLGKELDRANRHYLTSLQALRNFKMPPLQLNIRANTAVVGQNQMVQTNNESK